MSYSHGAKASKNQSSSFKGVSKAVGMVHFNCKGCKGISVGMLHSSRLSTLLPFRFRSTQAPAHRPEGGSGGERWFHPMDSIDESELSSATGALVEFLLQWFQMAQTSRCPDGGSKSPLGVCAIYSQSTIDYVDGKCSSPFKRWPPHISKHVYLCRWAGHLRNT